MDLDLSSYCNEVSGLYASSSQLVRRVSERWASDNLYCPRCGQSLIQYQPNTPVYDFYCDHSNERFLMEIDNFQLKSTHSFPHNYFPNKIIGAEYSTTRKSLEDDMFPSLILLHYNRTPPEMSDALLIHRLSVTPNSIVARPPLSLNARRKGWQGSVILLNHIPEIGRIKIVDDSIETPKNLVMKNWRTVEEILTGDVKQRGWTSDLLILIEKMPEEFSLDSVYQYENYFSRLHPENMHVRDKIRQQLQILRDRGFLKFEGYGRYRKIRK